MQSIIQWLEAGFSHVPFQFLEVWGRFGYLVGFLLMLAAFGGFTFRPGGRWGLGRERQTWDARAFLAIGLTAVLIPLTGYLGSSIALVPGAQTFESLKDLVVFLCIVLFGYPALLVTPAVYMLSDLIEGTPPDFIRDWLFGYWINPACFWVAYQLIGKNPDFRQLRTWGWYLLFVVIFMAIEPPLWGYICAGMFTPEISYRSITPALLFTTAITFSMAPFAMLVALPLARKHGMYWAQIPGHVKERVLGAREWIWESGKGDTRGESDVVRTGWPIRVFIATPFIVLVLLMVSLVAYVTLGSGESAANALAARLHREIAVTINMSVDDYLDPAQNPSGLANTAGISALLQTFSISKAGRIFIVDRAGRLVASSSQGGVPAIATGGQYAVRSKDSVVQVAALGLEQAAGGIAIIAAATPFRFVVVKAQPLSRETWLAQATPYRDNGRQVDWIVVTAIPEANFLGAIQEGNSRSAMIVALALFSSFLMAVVLAGVVSTTLRRFSGAAQAMADGDLAQRVPGSRLEELGTLAIAFNHMAAQLQEYFHRIKANEEEIGVHRDHLEELVAERTRALVTALDRAETANRAKSAFLSNMSHELRTPLNAVIGFSRLLSHADNLNEGQCHDVAIINRSGSHLLTLINDVLDLSKIEAGRTQLASEDVDLARMLTDVTEMLRPRAEQAGLTLAHAISGPIGMVRTDGGKLLQVLINLLGNAIKFTRQGGVTLVVRASAAETGADMLRLDFSVRDTGIGIAAEDQLRVFEPFVQMETHAAAAGTGLGLAISRQYLHLLGGELTLESVLGQGSTFRFALVVRRGAQTQQPSGQDRRVISLPAAERGKRILVVDDTPDSLLLLRRLLEPLGFVVVQARDGIETVRLAASFAPDLIIMDWRMPGLDGVAATGQIRANTSGRQPKIVILSASAFEDERTAALVTGADDFMRKPLEENKFFAMLEHQLGLHFDRSERPVHAARRLPTRAALAALPLAVSASLRTAVSELSPSKLDEALATIFATHAELAADIKGMADAFEYAELWSLLSGEVSATH